MSKLEARLLEPALCLPFAGKPTCLACDVKGKYIAIGCDNGKVYTYLSVGDEQVKSGDEQVKSGDEQVKVLSHDSCQPVKLMSFCYEGTTDKAFLMTTLAKDPTVFLWNFTDKSVSEVALPSRATVLTWSPNFLLFYAGTEAGDVITLTVTVSESDSPILDLSKTLSKPANRDDYGQVVAVEESKEKGRLLIVFSSGMCLVRGNDSAVSLMNDEIPVAAWWKKEEKSFSVVCRSGNLFTIDCNSNKLVACVKIGGDGITKAQHAVSTATKELFIAYTGGATVALPKENEKSHVITMYRVHGHENDANVLEKFYKVVDFVFLLRQEEPSTKPLLAVLTESELVVLDTSTEEKIGYGLMRYSRSKSYSCIASPVTSLQHCGECSREFMEKFPLVFSSQTDEEKEIPQLVVTGHSDGSVRLWLCYCNGGSPSFELLNQMIVYTERYFSTPNKEEKQPGVSLAKVIDNKYLVVIKESKRVLLFALISKGDREGKPQSQEIVLKEDQDDSLAQPEALPTPPHFCPSHQHKHVQLLQHFSCHYQNLKKHCESLVPVTVNCVVYNEQMGMLAVGTEYGLVVLDVKENNLVQVIGSENKLLKLSHGSNKNIPDSCSKKCCDVVCLESLMVSWKEDEEAQHTLWVGTSGGSLGALNIIRERGKVLELKATEIGKVYKKSALREMHFHRKEIYKTIPDINPDKTTTKFVDEGENVILYATPYVAVIMEKHFQTYQILHGLAEISKDFRHEDIMWSGLVQSQGKPFIVYVTKDRHKLAGFCLTDVNHTFSKNLPVGCQPVEQDLFSSNGKHAIMKCSDRFYYIMDSA